MARPRATFGKLPKGACFVRVTTRAYRDDRVYTKVKTGDAIVRDSALHVGINSTSPVRRVGCDYAGHPRRWR